MIYENKMNNQGYIKSLNEWRVENVNVSGRLWGPGNHVKLNSTLSGPLIEIKNKYNAKFDIVNVKDYKNNEIFRIDKDGELFVKGEHFKQNDNTRNLELNEETGNDILVDRGQSIYFGNPSEDGCWKLQTNEQGQFIINKKIKGEWITRHCFD